MLTIEKLREYGADVESAVARCAGNEDLYLRLVGMVAADLDPDALAEAVNGGDLDKAFAIAHKLKGGVGNVGLTPLFGPVSELTELLRNKTPGDYAALCGKIAEETERLKALL